MSDFWSRRRASVEAEEDALGRAEEEARGAAIEAEAETDAELCEALGLPDPDSLGPGDDVSAFMRRVVPQRLRRRALRALWARDPRLANLDGLVDYGQDFTDAGMKAGVVATAYEVGRGFARRVAEAEPDPAEAEDGVEPTPVAVEPPAEVVAQAPTEAVEPAEAEAVEPIEDAHAPPRRRMRFAFAEDAA